MRQDDMTHTAERERRAAECMKGFCACDCWGCHPPRSSRDRAGQLTDHCGQHRKDCHMNCK